MTVHATWTKDIKISYVLNGGTLPQGAQTELSQDEYLYTLPTPVNADSTLLFAGWFTDPAFSKDSEIISANYGNGDVTVYAKWAPKTHKITYVTNGGALPSYARDTVAYDESYILPEPTRADYVFDGWYTNAQFDPNTYEVSWDYEQGDVTLYAKWSKYDE